MQSSQPKSTAQTLKPKPKEPYLVRVSSTTVKRRQTVLNLGKSQEDSAGTRLVEALNDKDPMSRSLAAQGIGKIKYVTGMPALEKILASDPYPEVRQAAANSLRQLEDPNAVGALNKALSDANANVRLAALAGIARYGLPSSRPFVEAAAKDSSVEVRRTVVFVLGRLEDTAAIPIVEQMLKDSDVSVRAGAAQTLGELRATASKPLLVPLLQAPEKGVQASAARSLLMLGDPMGLETARALARVHMGGEWRPLEKLALRAGYRTDTLKELSILSGFSTGIGLKMWGHELAYAYMPYGDLGDTHYVSLLMKFGEGEQGNRNILQSQNRISHEGTQANAQGNRYDDQQLMQLLSIEGSQGLSEKQPMKEKSRS